MHFLRAVGAVLSAFVGIRKRHSAAADFASTRPLHIIAAGILSVALFVGVILLIVQFAVLTG